MGSLCRRWTESYIQSSLATRLVRDTYAYYTSFLNTLVGYINHIPPGEPWKDSVAHMVLEHHQEKLALIRRTSPTYRDLVLRNYSYLRDQNKTKFWNTKLNRKQAIRSSRLRTVVASSGGGGTQNNNYCTICHRPHSGRNPCPAEGFTTAQRTRLGTGLRQRQYEKALRHCRDHQGEGTIDELIEAARDAATS